MAMPATHVFCPPLKQTAQVDVAGLLFAGTKSAEAHAACKALTEARIRLLNALSQREMAVDQFEGLLNNYVSLLRGLIDSPGAEAVAAVATETAAGAPPAEAAGLLADADTGAQPAKDASPLRYVINFTWSNTLGTAPLSTVRDAQFELVSVLQDASIWYAKKAQMTLSKEQFAESDAKEAFLYLRTAAGILKMVSATQLRRLSGPEKPSDANPATMQAYILQCMAEAQEISIVRAIELKHKPLLIAGIARDTFEKFGDSAAAIRQLVGDKKVGKWQRYLLYKSKILEAAAYGYYGIHLFDQEQCGNAIAVLRAAQTHMAKALELAHGYLKCEPKTPRPNEARQLPMAESLEKRIKAALEKAVRENGFIYHHKIPDILPALCESKSVVSEKPYELPPMSAIWTTAALGSYDRAWCAAQAQSGSGKGAGHSAGISGAGGGAGGASGGGGGGSSSEECSIL